MEDDTEIKASEPADNGKACPSCGAPVHHRSKSCKACGHALQTEGASAPAVITKSAKSATTVTVACKIPAGIDMQLCKKVVYWQDTPTGAVQRDRFDRFGQIYSVRGPAYPVGQPPEGFPAAPQIVGGYALTPGIPADFWDAWAEQNARSSFVVEKMVFAHSSRTDHAEGQARDNADLKSGLEPLNPKGDRRIPRSNNPAVSQITKNTTVVA